MPAVNWLIQWLSDANNLTAISTAGIFLFTVVLALVGIGQGWLLRKSVNLARDEFNATHRPKIVVRFVQGPFHAGKDDAATVFVTFANTGASEAKIVAIGCGLAIRKDFHWLPPGLEATPKPILPFQLDTGGRHTLTAQALPGEGSDINFYWGFISAADSHSPDGELCLVGEIEYLDKGGLRRHTGFIRVYDPKSQSWRTDKDSEYEYQD